MKKNRIDRDMPIGDLKRVKDFLPPPGELVTPEDTVKITLRLSQSSINYFKEQARKYHTKYQRMLRLLIDRYVERYS
jgi:predicted DNA binding CopG/RHH family protein